MIVTMRVAAAVYCQLSLHALHCKAQRACPVPPWTASALKIVAQALTLYGWGQKRLNLALVPPKLNPISSRPRHCETTVERSPPTNLNQVRQWQSQLPTKSTYS
jgi:hypothetical protein